MLCSWYTEFGLTFILTLQVKSSYKLSDAAKKGPAKPAKKPAAKVQTSSQYIAQMHTVVTL